MDEGECLHYRLVHGMYFIRCTMQVINSSIRPLTAKTRQVAQIRIESAAIINSVTLQ